MTFTRNVCAFCGGGPTTDEHVWGEWIKNTLLPHDIAKEGYDAFMGTNEEVTREWRTANFNITVNRFCDSCNTGWMSQLEGDTQSILTPMMLGERTVTELSVPDQDILSQWAYKTALTADFAFLNALADDSAPPIPRDTYRNFHETRRPPDRGVTIWTIARQLASPTIGGARSHQNLSPHKANSDETNFLYLVTIFVVFAVFQVAIVPQTESLPVPRTVPNIPRLWPPTNRPMDWPVGGGAFTPDALTDFVSRNVFL